MADGTAAGYTNWISGDPTAAMPMTGPIWSRQASGGTATAPGTTGIMELSWAGGEAGPGPYAQYLLDVDTADLCRPR